MWTVSVYIELWVYEGVIKNGIFAIFPSER